MRGIIYVRLSERDEDESTSITRQIELCSIELRRRGCAVSDADIFEEPTGYHTGRTDKRPAWQRMIATIKRDGDAIHFFAAANAKRVARNKTIFFNFLDLLAKHKIKPVFVQEPSLSADTPEGNLLLGVIASVNQYFSDSLSSEQKRNFALFKSGGGYVGGVPYGLKTVGHGSGRKLIADDTKTYKRKGKPTTGLETMTVLCKIYTEPRQRGMHALAHEMNLRGYMFRGRKFNFSSCHNALLQIARGTYKGFIDAKLVNAVALRLSQRKRRALNGRESKHEPYLLSRLVYCSHCGRTITIYRQPMPNGKVWDSYRHYDDNCKYRFNIAAHILDTQATNILRNIFDWTDEQRREIAERVAVASRTDDADKRESLEENRKRMESAYVRGLIQEDTYIKERESILNELATIKPDTPQKVTTVSEALAAFSDYATLIERAQIQSGWIANNAMRSIFEKFYFDSATKCIVGYDVRAEIKPYCREYRL